MTNGTLYYWDSSNIECGCWEISNRWLVKKGDIAVRIVMLYNAADTKDHIYKFVTDDGQHSPPFDIENIWIVQCWLVTLE